MIKKLFLGSTLLLSAILFSCEYFPIEEDVEDEVEQISTAPPTGACADVSDVMDVHSEVIESIYLSTGYLSVGSATSWSSYKNDLKTSLNTALINAGFSPSNFDNYLDESMDAGDYFVTNTYTADDVLDELVNDSHISSALGTALDNIFTYASDHNYTETINYADQQLWSQTWSGNDLEAACIFYEQIQTSATNWTYVKNNAPNGLALADGSDVIIADGAGAIYGTLIGWYLGPGAGITAAIYGTMMSVLTNEGYAD